MKEQVIFLSIIATLTGVIIYLAVMLLQPPEVVPEMNFEYLMELTQGLRNELSEVNITYVVNISLNNTVDDFVVGEMNYYKNETDMVLTLSENVRDYEGYGILLAPERLIDFIQVNERQEYAGELMNYNLTKFCWSTITVPTSDRYERALGGDYLFVTCFDQEIGYPSLAYSSELMDESVAYSEVYITNYTYRA